MKYVGFIIFFLVVVTLSAHAQKTTRLTVIDLKGCKITRSITEENGAVDTLFMMSGQNAKYTHITDIAILKAGTAQSINDLLTECMKFITEAKGTSLDLGGNTLMSMGNGTIMLFDGGINKYIMLNKSAIMKLQTALLAHL